MKNRIFENILFCNENTVVSQKDNLTTFSLIEGGFKFSISAIKKNGIVYIVDEKINKIDNHNSR